MTYGAGTVRPRQNSTRSEAPAIVFTTVRGLPITWSFVDERHRDWELGRLMELTYVPVAKQSIEIHNYEISKDGRHYGCFSVFPDTPDRAKLALEAAGFTAERCDYDALKGAA